MTKTILTGASMLALGMATPLLAQTAPTAPAECDGVVGNCSVVSQAGEDNEATVDQTESGNVSDVFQDGVELVADVTQGGGTGNLSIIEQTGDLYDAEVVQDGDSNVSTITQTPPDDVTFTSSSVFVEQLGDENFSEVTQSGDLSQNVEVYQDGFKNSSTVSQGQAFGISALNDVIVEQLGELNESTVTQGNLEESDLNVAEVSQDGLRNVSEITQNSGPIFFGNSADVEQFADDGFSSITQSGDDNLAVVRQYSDGNTSFVMQNNTANTAFVNQGEGPLPIPDMPLPQ